MRLTLLKLRTSIHKKKITLSMRRLARDWEKFIIIYKAGKEFQPRIYKKLL